MIVRKNLSLRVILSFAGFHFIWLIAYMSLITVLYQVTGFNNISLPWLPVSLIGTSVAFYAGFKNNQAYDRMWEGRKIWGAIVNSSRSWGIAVNSFISDPNLGQKEIRSIKTRLIYRHIAWLYTLRAQLLAPTQWEHVSLKKRFGSINVRRRETQGEGLFKHHLESDHLKRYFTEEAEWKNAANKATQIISKQAAELADLSDNQKLDVFKQIQMQKMLNELYEHQGRAERIKKTPFPRQYASFSFIFTCIFIIVLPLGIVAEFSKLGDWEVWLTIPFGSLVGWIYVVMELIGDYSENPFEGLSTDVPMLSLCRTIEIDLLQIIEDPEVPEPIQVINSVLM